MANRIALAGKPLAGKTTLAYALQDTHEYTHASVSDYIIDRYVQLKNEPRRVEARGGWLYTVEYVKQNKHYSRVDLQEMGADLGLDSPDTVIATLSSVLKFAGAWDKPDMPVVLEAIRGELQASAARALGFVVVNVGVDEETQRSRAGSEETYQKIKEATRTRPDIENGVDSASILITTALSLEGAADLLAFLPEEGLSHGPATQPFEPYSLANWGRY